MPVVTAHFLGRFGNQCAQYLCARGFAERNGFEFQPEPWIGQKIFDLNDAPLTAPPMPRRSERDLIDGKGDFDFFGYAQCTEAITYTRTQAKKWFTLRPEIAKDLHKYHGAHGVAAHRRAGDYFGYGYVVVSSSSYMKAAQEFGLGEFMFVSEVNTVQDPEFKDDLSFLPDFYLLMTAYVLLRGNSTFSWLAGLLGSGRVFAPIIDGLEGGREHDCKFVEGNWPRFANLDFTTEMRIPE